MNSRAVWPLFWVLFLFATLSITAAQDTDEKPEFPPGDATELSTLSNDVLDCEFDERHSTLWRYMYEPGNWGESCWREHYALYTASAGYTMVSDDPGFSISVPFVDPGGGPGTITAVTLTDDGAFEIGRTMIMLAGPVRFFDIEYVVTNVSSTTQNDVRFFQTIDFDIPYTGDHEDDYGYYEAEDDYIWIVDYDYYQNGIRTTLRSDHHGMDYYETEMFSDWDDGVLNDRDSYGPGDPAIGKQFNLGTILPGERREIDIRVWFGEPVFCETDEECDDGSFCDGEEWCDENGDCQPSDDPVVCEDDGVYCNGEETCDDAIDECVHAGDPCEDDGVFCNGEESCDETTQECLSSGDPCEDDGVYCNGVESCDEDHAECIHTDEPCADDGAFCNGVESCDEESHECSHTGDPCTDDGLFCNGTETCDEQADECAHTGEPCPDNGLFCDGIESCDEDAQECLHSGNPCPADGIDCTVDACDEDSDSCGYVPDDALCDNGLFCDGVETCDAAFGCLAGEPVVCLDDGVFCNGGEFCDDEIDACSSTGDPCADDGEFCNGDESCDEEEQECLHSGDPCEIDETCDEDANRCVGPPAELDSLGGCGCSVY